MSGYQCPRCEKRGKTWQGDDPKCGFGENGKFIDSNWNCATLNALRDLESCDYGRVRADEENMKVIPVTSVDFSDNKVAIFLILCWYKSRGRLPFARVMFSDYSEEEPTLDYAEKVLLHFGVKP